MNSDCKRDISRLNTIGRRQTDAETAERQDVAELMQRATDVRVQSAELEPDHYLYAVHGTGPLAVLAVR